MAPASDRADCMRGCMSWASCGPIALRRYCVAASCGPFRISRASLIVMFWIADKKRAFAFGVAASAARLSRVSRSLVRLFIPMVDRALSTFASVSGNGILMFGSALKPLNVPSWLTTCVDPMLSASFRPWMISVLLRVARDVWPPRIVFNVSAFKIVPTLTPHPLLEAFAPHCVTQEVRAMQGRMRRAVFKCFISLLNRVCLYGQCAYL